MAGRSAHDLSGLTTLGAGNFRIANPEAMLAAGGMQDDPALVELMHDARSRLERVAAALRSR